MLQRHVNRFRELKSPRKPTKPRLLTGSSEEAEATNLERQEKYDLKMNDWDKEDQRLEQFRKVYAIDDTTVVFGSPHRVARIKLPDTSAYQSENLPDTANRLNKLVDSVSIAATYHEGVSIPTKEFSDLLRPFLKEAELVKMEFEDGKLTVLPRKPMRVEEAPLLLRLTYSGITPVLEPFSFGINVRTFHEALKLAQSLGHKDIQLTCTSSVRPILIKAEGIEYIIAPIRIH